MAVWVKSSPRIIIKHMQGVVKANEGEGETGTVVLCGRQNTLCVALGESCAICVLGCLLCGLAFSLHHVRSFFLCVDYAASKSNYFPLVAICRFNLT